MADPMPRFDGAAAWMKLTARQQAVIGAIALELVVAWRGDDIHAFPFSCGVVQPPEARPFRAAGDLLAAMLRDAAREAGGIVPALLGNPPVPIPSLLGPVCRVCRCSEYDACDGGCGWAEPDLCTACVEAA